jgi:DHA1 family inner membrane transport protein
VAAILFVCLFAAQSGQVALTPVLTDAARAFGISTAAAGQIRTAAAVVAAVAALAVSAAGHRLRLRVLLLSGLGLLLAGSVISVGAPSATVLAVGQALAGAASSIIVAAGVAAAVEWSDGASRGRVVAWALVGAPAAWIAAMPLIGIVAGTSWRFAFAVPVVAAGVAALALRHAPAAPLPRVGSALRTILVEPAVRAWAAGEVLAYAAWGGVLVYAGALFVESYGASAAAVGLSLGAGAAAYIPGTFVAQASAKAHGRSLLAATGVLLAIFVVAFGALRAGTVPSAVGFGVLCFLAGARTYLGSAVGLDLAGDSHVAAMSVRAAAAQLGWVVGGSAGGAALALGGYPALALVLAALFIAGAVPHAGALGTLTPRRRTRATRPGARRAAAAPARAR